MPFDEKLRHDVRSVLQATAILDITEFELFHLAYSHWHGAPIEDPVLEPFFTAYMFADVVPVWARHYSRLVERLDRMGQLDPVALGVKRLPRSREMVSRGIRYSVIIGTVLVVLIVLAEFVSQFMKLGDRCLFPPCY